MILNEYYEMIENLGSFNEEADIEYKTLDDILNESDEEKDSTETNPRMEVRDAIKPQVEIANSVIDSIKSAFSDNCNQTQKYTDMQDQIKNWEKTIRGACEQIISIVESKGLMKKDNGKYIAWDGRPLNKVCSPAAYKKILQNDNRDRSILDWCAGIIIFYNSLT